jgi:diphthamide synthase (EF-2-diphthine--ammonia ligase)
VLIPSPCPNEVYEAETGRALAAAKADGVSHVVFGDLFLRDVRDYREAQLAEFGLTGSFPLWGKDTAALAREMVEAGMSATITCVDPRRLDGSFAGRQFDGALLDDLPDGVDPCGENGEFHTVVTAGPMFREPVPVRTGPVVEREGFVFADVLLDY